MSQEIKFNYYDLKALVESYVYTNAKCPGKFHLIDRVFDADDLEFIFSHDNYPGLVFKLTVDYDSWTDDGTLGDCELYVVNPKPVTVIDYSDVDTNYRGTISYD